MTQKRIGILTSGGDCAGLNAAIRGAVHRASHLGWEILGIRDGSDGLTSRPTRVQPLTLADVSTTMLRQGGTILGSTNKGDPFTQTDANGVLLIDLIMEGFRDLKLDALIGIGGDGGLAIQSKIAKMMDLPYVGIPKTMDNDVGITEVSIGYDTAVAVATEAIDRLQPTAASHSRVMILEVMGRDAGHVALAAGIAGGADVILIPEIGWKLESIVAKIREIQASGRNHALIVVSEAIKTETGEGLKQTFSDGQKRYGGVGNYIATLVAEATGAETRVTVLGHVTRGAPPTHMDRQIGLAFGVHAVDLVAAGKFGRMLAWSNRKVIDVPLDEAVAQNQQVDVDGTLVHTARALGICLGS